MKRTILLFGMFVILLFGIICPVSAESITVDERTYIITPMAKSSDDYSVLALPQVGVILPGQSLEYYYEAEPGSTELDVSLSWTLFPLNNALSLSITTPAGDLLGEFEDSYDGEIDGNIQISIRSADVRGQWKIIVNDKNVLGVQPFSLSINEL